MFLIMQKHLIKDLLVVLVFGNGCSEGQSKINLFGSPTHNNTLTGEIPINSVVKPVRIENE